MWNPNKCFPSQWTQFQEAQDQAWKNASRNATQQPSTISEPDTKENKEKATTVANWNQNRAQEDSDEDVAKPLVDWQGIWNNALMRHGLSPSQAEPVGKEQEDVDLYSEIVCHPSRSHLPSRSSSPAFSKSSLVFSDKKSKINANENKKTSIAAASSSGGDMMFKRCKPTKVYETEQGLGGSYMVVKEDDAEEEWEVLDGAAVEDDWNIVEETEGCRDGGKKGKMGFNDEMRVFLEDEKGKREIGERDSPFARESLKGKATQEGEPELD
jgi:hypothetical protein